MAILRSARFLCCEKGARRHGLPEHWLQFLDGLSPSE